MANENILAFLQTAPERDIRQQLTMGNCSLLTAAVHGQDLNYSDDVCYDSWTPFRKKMGFWSASTSGRQIKQFDAWPLFEKRLRCLQAYQEGPNFSAKGQGNIFDIFSDYIRCVCNSWAYQPLPKTKQVEEQLASAADSSPWNVSYLPSYMLVVSASSAGLFEVMTNLAQEYGWCNPGVSILGEMLAALIGDTRKPTARTETWVMFASNHPDFPKGVVARLSVERLSEGCGLLLPDPYRCGYFWMPGGTFSNGLENAWLAARLHLEQCDWFESPHQSDWRWRIELLGVAEQLEFSRCILPITGRSAEVAFASALIAATESNPDRAHDGNPIDQNMAVSATFSVDAVRLENDERRWQLSDDVRLPIRPVQSIKTKTLLGNYIDLGILEVERLSAVVIAESQPPETLPLNDNRFSFPRAGTLADAYEKLVKFPRITIGVNQEIAKRTKEALDRLCTPYIQPELADAVLWRQAVQANPSLAFSQPPPEALISRFFAETETSNEIEERNWSRVFVEAESGQGKSMFLLHGQYQLASNQTLGVLPIRFGRTLPNDLALSDFDWKSLSAQSLLESPSLNQYVEAFRDANEAARGTRLGNNDFLDWINWMIQQGRVAFYLDALDQTDRSGIQHLATKLASEPWKRCEVMMTGRPEAKFVRSSAFRGSEWWVWRLAPFDSQRWNRYLGTDKAEGTIDEAILAVPILLSMLKLLLSYEESTPSLGQLKRIELYDQAISHLVTKGFESVGDENTFVWDYLPNATAVRLWLASLAHYMVQSQGFINDLHGEDFEALEFQLGKQSVLALDAIDITTSRQLIESSARSGLSFRHRSFLEYFLGYYLTNQGTIGISQTDRLPLKQPNKSVVELLTEIHQVFDGSETTTSWPSLPEWENTLRFMLGIADITTRNFLASELIALGNPFVVYRSLAVDRVIYSQDIEYFVRWICFLEFIDRGQGESQAISVKLESGSMLTFDDAKMALERLAIPLSRLQSRTARNASLVTTINAFWQGVGSPYSGAKKDETELLDRMHYLRSGDGTYDFFDSFVTVPGGHFDLRDCWTEHNLTELKEVEFELQSFELLDFPVTNEMFELFCPSHRMMRDSTCSADDQPVVHVSYLAALEFCDWLSELTGDDYGLPTEEEWEWACRWPSSPNFCSTYWWGQEFREDLCWSHKRDKEGRSRGRGEAIAALSRSESKHSSWEGRPTNGLIDMLGNVWEMCVNYHVFKENESVWVRGGCWWDAYLPNFASGYRGCVSPFEHGCGGVRHRHGFRVVRQKGRRTVFSDGNLTREKFVRGFPLGWREPEGESK